MPVGAKRRKVFGRTVTVRRVKVAVARTDAVAHRGALLRVGFLPLCERGEGVGPRLRAGVANLGRHRQAFTHRRSTVGRHAELAKQLEI